VVQQHAISGTIQQLSVDWGVDPAIRSLPLLLLQACCWRGRVAPEAAADLLLVVDNSILKAHPTVAGCAHSSLFHKSGLLLALLSPPCCCCCCRPAAGEEELRQKQLQTFCGMMLERYEDEVLQALTTDAFSTHGEGQHAALNLQHTRSQHTLRQQHAAAALGLRKYARRTIQQAVCCRRSPPTHSAHTVRGSSSSSSMQQQLCACA
jgi:hypothetical protein